MIVSLFMEVVILERKMSYQKLLFRIGEMAASIADNQFVNMRFNYFRNELVGWKYLKEYLYFLKSIEFS